MAWSWNPTRTRGVGVQDMLATSQGLWVGSDTDRIGGEFHSNIALMPLAGGKTLPVMSNPTLPGTVYSVAVGASQLKRRDFNGAASSVAPATAPNGSVSWGSTVGAFMSHGTLYTAASNGHGDKADLQRLDLWLVIRRGRRGHPGQADRLAQHRCAQPDQPVLLQRRDVLHQVRGVDACSGGASRRRATSSASSASRIAAVSGINYGSIRGAFVANDKFYYSGTTGRLWRADWSGRSPVGGTQVQVSGPGKDSQNWASRAMFVFTD